MKYKNLFINCIITLCKIVIISLSLFVFSTCQSSNWLLDYTISQRFIQQPIDHAKPLETQFDQQVFVLKPKRAPHDSPVFFILGAENSISKSHLVSFYHSYNSPGNVIFILAEHRGYGQSISSDTDQSFPVYVSYAQAIDDYHHVVEELKNEFSGPWMAAGFSYGGGLSIQFGLNYPDDIKVILSSSGVVDWKFSIPEYDRQVQINLGTNLYKRLVEHVKALTPGNLFDQNWIDREFLYAIIVSLAQFGEFQNLKPIFKSLVALPTKEFIVQLHKIDKYFGNQALSYAMNNCKKNLSIDEVRSGKWDWRIWRYTQCVEAGTFFAPAQDESVFTRSYDEWVSECKALFGVEPQTAKGIVWPLRSNLINLKIPLVYVAGGKDPWKDLGIKSQTEIPIGKYFYAKNEFHTPDRLNPALATKVLEKMLQYIKNNN